MTAKHAKVFIIVSIFFFSLKVCWIPAGAFPTVRQQEDSPLIGSSLIGNHVNETIMNYDEKSSRPDVAL